MGFNGSERKTRTNSENCYNKIVRNKDLLGLVSGVGDGQDTKTEHKIVRGKKKRNTFTGCGQLKVKDLWKDLPKVRVRKYSFDKNSKFDSNSDLNIRGVMGRVGYRTDEKFLEGFIPDAKSKFGIFNK